MRGPNPFGILLFVFAILTSLSVSCFYPFPASSILRHDQPLFDFRNISQHRVTRDRHLTDSRTARRRHLPHSWTHRCWPE